MGLHLRAGSFESGGGWSRTDCVIRNQSPIWILPLSVAPLGFPSCDGDDSSPEILPREAADIQVVRSVKTCELRRVGVAYGGIWWLRRGWPGWCPVRLQAKGKWEQEQPMEDKVQRKVKDQAGGEWGRAPGQGQRQGREGNILGPTGSLL